jgi:basic amino acid/polyamine antiporter, APA family
MSSTRLKRRINLLDATMLVMGSMIGSGIFIVSASVAMQVGSAGFILLTWLLAGILTIIAALSYGELAGMMPKAGGQYVYLREAYGPLVGFLFGWTTFLVIETGLIAAVSMAFAKFAAALMPSLFEPFELFNLGTFTFTTLQLTALLVVNFLTIINLQGIELGKMVQNLFTMTKISALGMLIFIGLYIGFNGFYWNVNTLNFWEPFKPLADIKGVVQYGDFWHPFKTVVENGVVTKTPLGGFALISAIGLAMIGPIFSSSAFNTITYTASEIIEPKVNIPRSLFLGTLGVAILYFLANLAYIAILPTVGVPNGSDVVSRGIAFANQDRVGTAVAEVLFDDWGADIMAIFIMISTFGCVNGIILAGARVYYAMAKDGLFFRRAATLHSESRAPRFALIIQAVWASLLCLSGTYTDLLKYVTFATLLFYILTIGAVFILRTTSPDVERPYKAFGYPYIPALYILVASAICVNLLVFEQPITLFGASVKPSWVGLSIVLLGIPVYYLSKIGKNTEGSPLSE